MNMTRHTESVEVILKDQRRRRRSRRSPIFSSAWLWSPEKTSEDGLPHDGAGALACT